MLITPLGGVQGGEVGCLIRSCQPLISSMGSCAIEGRGVQVLLEEITLRVGEGGGGGGGGREEEGGGGGGVREEEISLCSTLGWIGGDGGR